MDPLSNAYLPYFYVRYAFVGGPQVNPPLFHSHAGSHLGHGTPQPSRGGKEGSTHGLTACHYFAGASGDVGPTASTGSYYREGISHQAKTPMGNGAYYCKPPILAETDK